MRYQYLDNLRGMLMMLGIVLHTCAAFSPSGYWLVTYPEKLVWTDSVNAFIHYFRMPMFFMVSGFFATFLLNRQSVKTFLSTKCTRILLPCLSALIVFNLPQYFLLEHLALAEWIEVTGNTLIGHLWFLINLFVYLCLAVILHRILNVCSLNKALASQTTKKRLSWSLLAVVMTTLLFYPSMLALNKLGLSIYEPIPLVGSMFMLFGYFDYFLFGLLVAYFTHQHFVDYLCSKRVMLVIIILMLCSFMQPSFTSGMINVLLSTIQERLGVLCLCLLIWVFATKFANSSSSFMKSLTEASYSIYLIHHLMIIIIIILLSYTKLNSVSEWLNANLAFVLVLLSVSIISFLMHRFLINKSGILRLLFNGK